MSVSIGVDRNFMRFFPFIGGLSRDEYKVKLMENDSVTPDILERELSIYDYIEKRYSNVLKLAREEDVLFEFVIDQCKLLKDLNIVLGETDGAVVEKIFARLDKLQKEEENRIKNEILCKRQKKMKRKLKAKNRRK
ncbi:hypothetical protein [Rodentibacter pneumotropicus]|uniref:Uncharacterized protein n=1 Tax=Rodentibacter pneumotropicus TaxID=758 RepID=A0A4S2PXR6_9PAST|nr:hypothetical protein [Rodentibacter pneumotropicus]THA08729.1 hypothetical protein D3M78_07275 [Rodentibacter pneumotropicus]